ncbi:unnamed protein product [Microthlaspi erraticum]|uniref:Uncharacterized protein n=1 Tax=Microthlaspi erraticum TaxID=1685480 RepID=A0A6D2KKW6_9BRAS|nr:unnamed protein product [Microthlaspi erraticum]
MAAFRCPDFASPSILLPSYSTGKRISLKVIRCSSSVSIPLSSKLPKRKNYLRPKILRTQYPQPQETVIIGIESPENAPFSNQDNGVEELQVSSSSVASNELNGILSMLSPMVVAKYGLYLIGLLAFQTVCAVLFLGNSTKSGKKPGNSSDTVDSRSLSSILNGKNGGRASNVVSLEDLEMSEKIAEIRAMAREARNNDSSPSSAVEASNPGGGIEIEKEIEARLSSMEKRLNSQRKGLAGFRVEPLDDESINGDLKDDSSLMFEKKYKFKAEKPLTGNVKGFGGSKGNNEVKFEKTGQNGNVSDSGNGEKNPEEQIKDAGHADSKMISGAAQESEQRRPSKEVNKSIKSGNQVGHKPNVEAGSGFGRASLSGRKGKPMRRAMEKQSEKENKMWWLKLPYVLRILMRSRIDQDISEGYFTIRTESVEQKEGEVSHMVAFEDQSDAINFSYLLESVFEDLDEFSAYVVPISTNDLHNEVSSGGKNVIVVKKRQLKLYAGQPFEDVERALHKLIQEQR